MLPIDKACEQHVATKPRNGRRRSTTRDQQVSGEPQRLVGCGRSARCPFNRRLTLGTGACQAAGSLARAAAKSAVNARPR